MFKKKQKDLKKKHPTVFTEPQINGTLEFKYSIWLEEKKKVWNFRKNLKSIVKLKFNQIKLKELKGELWAFNELLIVFVDNKVIGGLNAFLDWARVNYNFEDFRNDALYETLRSEEYAAYLASKNVIKMF